MLEPSQRRLLLEALRPPFGFGLDLAIGTTFSLDLHALLTAPLAFAMFDWETGDEHGDGNVIASLEAVRRHAERIHLFCQAGEIAVPSKYRPLVGHIEESVHEIRTPPGGIFHPKLWVLRFRRPADGDLSYRVLCLSRNLTFDRAWDTVLALEGTPVQGSVPENGPLVDFLMALPEMMLWPAPAALRENIETLADELHALRFHPPIGFDSLAFRPLGVAGFRSWPFEDNYDRMLIISPFLTQGTVTRLSRTSSRGVLVSRPESLDALGDAGLSAFEQTFVLSSDSSPVIEQQDEDSSFAESTNEVIGERAGIELTGLHAKLYVAERADTAWVWTGSANASDAAYNTNIEFLIELRGSSEHCGVDSFMGSGHKEVGLIDILTPYSPADEPLVPSAEEEAQLALDEAARTIASLQFTTHVATTDDDRYSLLLEADEPLPQGILEGIRARCWPITLPREAAAESLPEQGTVRLDFGERSFDAITSFFAFELATAAAAWPRRFVINARLVGAPADRKERMLASLLNNANDFLAYLRFLLADLEEAQAVLESLGVADGGAQLWATRATHPAVLEPIIRALARDPERLDHIERLIDDLRKTPDGLDRLPPDFLAVWEPIWEARRELTR